MSNLIKGNSLGNYIIVKNKFNISFTIDALIRYIIYAIAFSLPFSLFCYDLKGGGDSRIEPAHFFSLLLMLLTGSIVIWKGKLKSLKNIEYALIACLSVACLSLLVAQLRFNLHYQLIKGSKAILGLIFVIVVFILVRRYITTKSAFIKAAKWQWRGCLILAVLGLWQSIALNLLDTSFLADWAWVDNLLGHSFNWSGRLEIFGPIIRAKSLAMEPAHYCQYLLISLGFVVCRLFPFGSIKQDKSWNQYLPSFFGAILFLLAYLLSFSIVGLFGLILVSVAYIILFKQISLNKFIIFSLLMVVTISALSYASKGLLINKIATIAMIFPGTEKRDTGQALSTLIVAGHIETTVKSLYEYPLLGCGIGGHRANFDRFAPTWVFENELLSQLNVEDASSLFLRLLSEMGIIGFLLFVGTFTLIIFRAWQAIRLSIPSQRNRKVLVVCAGLLTSAIAEVSVYLVRMPGYYYINFWFLLAMTSLIPDILKKVADDYQRNE